MSKDRKDIIEQVNISSFASHIARFCGSHQEAIEILENYCANRPQTSKHEVYRQVSEGNSTAKYRVSEQHPQHDGSLKHGHWK